MKELVDKEVVVIDKEEYVKVLNPKALEGKDQPKYIYVPVNEYLSNREAFSTPKAQTADVKKEVPPLPERRSSALEESPVASLPKSTSPGLKKRVLISYFDDRTADREEAVGDWVAEKLMKEVSRRSLQVLFADYETAKEFLRNKESGINLESPKALESLNEIFGVRALVVGQLSGPYVFSTKTANDQEGTALAIIKIDIKVIDTFSGKTVKTLSASNPIFAAKEKGSFSAEKARVKAIDLAVASLGRSLAKELESMDWFCRITKVEGDEVYMNAGKLTGLKVGDVMEIFRHGEFGERGEVKGRIRVSSLFGIDASTGKLIQGKNPDVNDILKFARSEGT